MAERLGVMYQVLGKNLKKEVKRVISKVILKELYHG